MNLETLIKVSPNTPNVVYKNSVDALTLGNGRQYNFSNLDNKVLTASNGVKFAGCLPKQIYNGRDLNRSRPCFPIQQEIKQVWETEGVLYRHPFTTPWIEFYDPIARQYKNARFKSVANYLDPSDPTDKKFVIDLVAERENGGQYIIEHRQSNNTRTQSWATHYEYPEDLIYELYLSGGIMYNFQEHRFDILVQITTAFESWNPGSSVLEEDNSDNRAYAVDVTTNILSSSNYPYGLTETMTTRYTLDWYNVQDAYMADTEIYDSTYRENVAVGRIDPWGTAYYRGLGNVISTDDDVNLLGFCVKAPNNFIPFETNTATALVPQFVDLEHNVDI